MMFGRIQLKWAIIRAMQANQSLASTTLQNAKKADSVALEFYKSVGIFQVSKGAKLYRRDTFAIIVSKDFKALDWQQYGQL
jgi:hypothetical protein